jgi:hypothetical protein
VRVKEIEGRTDKGECGRDRISLFNIMYIDLVKSYEVQSHTQTHFNLLYNFCCMFVCWTKCLNDMGWNPTQLPRPVPNAAPHPAWCAAPAPIPPNPPWHPVPAAPAFGTSMFATWGNHGCRPSSCHCSGNSTTTKGLDFFHTYIQNYFCNTQMKQLQHTSEIDEIFGTYTCNIDIATYAISR